MSDTYSDSSVLCARMKLFGASEVLAAARERQTELAARVLQLELGRMLHEHPAITAFTYDVDFEVDKGYYFQVVSLSVEGDFSSLRDGESDPEEDVRDVDVWSVDAVVLAFGEGADEWAGSVTREQLFAAIEQEAVAS